MLLTQNTTIPFQRNQSWNFSFSSLSLSRRRRRRCLFLRPDDNWQAKRIIMLVLLAFFRSVFLSLSLIIIQLNI